MHNIISNLFFQYNSVLKHVLKMFYDSNKVNNILLCKQCEGRLDIPKNLPCGEAICSICESTIQV